MSGVIWEGSGRVSGRPPRHITYTQTPQRPHQTPLRPPQGTPQNPSIHPTEPSQIPPDTTHTPSRHLSDTSQTPPRHTRQPPSPRPPQTPPRQARPLVQPSQLWPQNTSFPTFLPIIFLHCLGITVKPQGARSCPVYQIKHEALGIMPGKIN